MAINPKNNLFAPPTPEELQGDLFAPPRKEELAAAGPADLFAPPKPEELGEPITPTGKEGELTSGDIEKIAAKYNVSAEDLRQLAPYYGAKEEVYTPGQALARGLRETAGFVGRGPLLNIPQFLYKKAQSPEMERALDELSKVGREQQTGLELATEIIAPGAALKAAGTALGKIGQAALVGGTVGVASSEQGKELKSGAIGATLGAGLGGAAVGLGKLASTKGAKVAEEVAEKEVKGLAEVQQAKQKLIQEVAPSEQIIRNKIFSGTDDLTAEEVETILRQQKTATELEDLANRESLVYGKYAEQVSEAEAKREKITPKLRAIEEEAAALQTRLRELPDRIESPVNVSNRLNNVNNQLLKETESLTRLRAEINELQKTAKLPDEGPLFAKRTANALDVLTQREEMITARVAELTNNKQSLLKQLEELPGLIREKNSIESRLAALDEKYPKLFKKGAKISTPETPEVIRTEAAKEILRQRAVDFANELTGKNYSDYDKAVKAIKYHAERFETPEFINKAYDNLVDSTLTRRAITQTGFQVADQAGFGGKALNFISDPQFIFRRLDRKYKTNLEQDLSTATKKYNRFLNAQKAYDTQLTRVVDEGRKLGLDRIVTEDSRLFDAANLGRLDTLTKEEQEIVRSIRGFIDDVRQFATKGVTTKEPGISRLIIPTRENYVPHVLKRTEEIAKSIDEKLAQVAKEYNVVDAAMIPGSLRQLQNKSPAIKELIEAATLFDKRPITSMGELVSRLKGLTTKREGLLALETKANAALERNDVIPDFLLEKNLYRLADRYMNNTLRHLYMRESIDSLTRQANTLGDMGAAVEKDYIKRLVADVQGIRDGTWNSLILRTKLNYNKTIDKLIANAPEDSVKRGTLVAAKALPDILEAMSRQIYPNTLGYWNLRAALQNLTQVVNKVAPEIGGFYGYGLALRAVKDIAKQMPRGEFSRLVTKAKALGNMPPDFSARSREAIAEGIERSALYRIPANTLQGFADMGMKLFTLGEELNRALTVKIAEKMAEDLASKGPYAKFAQRAVRRMELNGRLGKVAPDQLGNELARYLNDATMYNYNRLNQAEFGRMLGPFFSVFSKWPTATAGEIIAELETKGAFKGSTRLAEKFIVPLMIWQAVDASMGEENTISNLFQMKADGLSDREKKLLGSYGFSQTAPIGAVQSIATGEIFSPPLMGAFNNLIVKPVKQQDPELVLKGAEQFATTYGPTAGFYRFLFDDIPTLLTGERPEGETQLRKNIEGLRRLTE